MLVLHLGTVQSHELSQAKEILDVVARFTPADGDPGSDLSVRGGAEVNGVVGGSDVDEGQLLSLGLVPGGELHHLSDVPATDGLSRVQVL